MSEKRLAELEGEYSSLNDTPFKESNSKKSLFWKCPESHLWKATIHTRLNNGKNCPVCEEPENYLIESPLMEEWDWSKNENEPNLLTRGSKVRAWWKCNKCYHEWDATIIGRMRLGYGCPECKRKENLVKSRLRSIEKYGSIASQSVIDEWDWNKNDENPEDLPIHYTKKLWWIGKDCGHSWDALPANRIKKGSGCPYCVGEKVLAGFNDLATTNPELLEWWSPNNEKLMSEVSAGSSLKSLWKCYLGHEWSAVISSVAKGRRCRYCAKKAVLEGFNDLATTHPEIVEKEWSFSKNSVLPSNVSAGSDLKVYWECPIGHSYKMSLHKKIKMGQGCSYCAGKRVDTSNSLESTNPNIASMWIEAVDDPGLTPASVTSGSSKNILWRGEVCDHSFQRSVKGMFISKKCPYCEAFSNTQLLEGFNDLESRFPEVAKEWHPNKNGELTPNIVLSGSKKSSWWKCNKGHEWKVSIDNRTRSGSTCSRCSMVGSSKMERDLSNFIESLGATIETNSRQVIPPLELDIYVPEKKIAIEFNGIYWHSDEVISKRLGKDSKNVHYKKWKDCKDKGIQLITVWEDDWKKNPEIIKKMLIHKLGISKQEKIGARETSFDKCNSSIARDFLNDNHLQGYKNFTRSFGLSFEGKPVAVMSFSIRDQTATLDRYATSNIVIGGFSKLLKSSINELTKEFQITEIVTFADHEVSDGRLYEVSGFSLIEELKPDYKYVYEEERQHKFLFRKKRFREDPDLKFFEGLTEQQLAQLNGISRVYDSGKGKYSLIL